MSTTEVARAEWGPRLASLGLDSLNVLLAEASPGDRLPGRWTPLVKPGLGGRERWRWELPGADGAMLYLKRYRAPGWGAQFDRQRRQTRRHSRAWWEYQISRRLNDESVPAVIAVAAVEQMRAARELRSAVLFETAPGDAFDRAWPQLVANGAAITRGRPRQALFRALGRFVSALHQTGRCHRDLYLCHVFLDADPTGQNAPRFTLIDLARVFQPRWRRMRWVLKDLSQLDLSARQIGLTATDRLRGLVAYLGLNPGSPRVRWYIRRILRRSDAIRRRIERRSARA